ncbi:RNA polymerase sigma factor [Terriglobus tenax]|uniref:RNA polymerase sigma factor n=1 Tax=Terriglobus tenax TaxID=1111115 RepID=UPI0021E0BB2D|nr:sigma-70 family RNA polymerase sigma factor [Terriglobus tenax]
MGNLVSAIGIRAEDAALVAELKAGSEEAFAQLIGQYSQPIYSVIARSLQDPADAADITQDVFIKVFRNIGSFHGDSSLRTWIYRIALHEASNQRRWWKRHKKQEITIDGEFESDDPGDSFYLKDTLASQDDSPFDLAIQSETRVRVEAALQQVPEAFRTVLILREIEGFAYDEIAEILDINMGTVKSRLMRGRAAMRQILQSREALESQLRTEASKRAMDKRMEAAR